MTVKLAVIGAGRIGQIHATNAARNPNVQLVGVADAIPAAAQKLAGTLGTRVVDVEQLGRDLHRRLDALVDFAKRATGTGEQRHQSLKGLLTGYLFAELQAHGCPLPSGRILELWETDIELNAQGLEVWLDRR